MRFNFRASGPALIFFLLNWRPAVQASTLESLDHNFSVTIPGQWTPQYSTDKEIVLLAKKRRAEIRIRALAQYLSEKALVEKTHNTIRVLKKSGASVRDRIWTVRLPSKNRILFTLFTLKGKKRRSGYFNLESHSYGISTMNISEKEFEAMAASLNPLPKADRNAGSKPSINHPQVPSAPIYSSGTLAAAPPAAPFGAAKISKTPGSQELPPLPQRKVGDSLLFFFIALVLSAAALGYRVIAGREIVKIEEPPVPGSAFPLHIERRYFSFPIVFDVQDAAGRQYRGVSYRIPGLMIGAGLALYFSIKILIQIAVLAGADIKKLSAGILMSFAGLLSVGALLILLGVILGIFVRKRLQILDATGNLLLDIRQKRLTFASLIFLVRDAAGQELAKIRRVGFVLVRRHWQLLDPEGNAWLDIEEDSVARALARKFLGHLWGLLRTNYVISTAGSEAGSLKREWSIWNRYRVHLIPPQGLDSRLVLAAVLFLDIIDPDRWHPWHG